MLEAIRRYSKQITVYVQRGRIQIPQIVKPTPLFGILEDMVIQVKAPGGGAFHPKVWAIRYVSPDQSSEIYRLVVLTRNMTTDQSWDLSLQLEGSIESQEIELNRPLAHFFNMLPGLATESVESEREEQAHGFAEALRKVHWKLPDGFHELAFYLPGTKGFDWQPPDANRVVIVSPFCSDHVLQTLATKSNAADALISRPESLSALNQETLALFGKCLHLDEAAETEYGNEDDTAEHPLATGLHAKVYLFERRHYIDYSHVIMGSANATHAALGVKKNIEILVELVGKNTKVGGIDELLGSDGLGEYLVEYGTSKETDTARRDAEDCVERARSRLSEVELYVKCIPGSMEGSWGLMLTGEIPTLEGIIDASAWPITVAQEYSVIIKGGDSQVRIKLGEFSASSLTGLIAFELRSDHPDVTARFVLNLPVLGIPEERYSAILQTVIRNRDGFIRYLLLLLGDDMVSELDVGSGGAWGNWLARLATGEDFPLLEELTRAYSRHPGRLKEISRLVRDLSRGSQNEVVPEDFSSLWTVFESAMGVRDA